MGRVEVLGVVGGVVRGDREGGGEDVVGYYVNIYGLRFGR